MKVFKNWKKGIEKFLIITTTGVFLSGTVFTTKSIGLDKEEIQNILEETASIEKNISLEISDYSYIPPLSNDDLIIDERFSLRDKMNLRVENQGITNECWAFSLIKSLETNIALKNNVSELGNFSERHMDYTTSRTFLDGMNEKAFKKEPGEGGLLVEGLAYLTNGEGAVLEEDLPFENNEKLISLDSIEKKANTIVNDYYMFVPIYKEYEYDEIGNTTNVKYLKADGTEYTEEELLVVRNEIKKHLVNDGAIASMTCGTNNKYYNNELILKSSNYNCNTNKEERDHAFTIVGWDDTYSKENFAEGAKPSTDGAYIVLNSFGPTFFDEGYLYVSYEDYFIESEMYGVQSSTLVDYEHIYQTDFYGGIYQIGNNTQNFGYYGAVFQKEEYNSEVINSIGVTLSTFANVEVYINPNGSEMNLQELIKVGETREELSPGYHRIYINPIDIKGEEFAVVIKQISSSGTFYIEVEAPIYATAYEYASSENNSYISFDGSAWNNLSDLEVYGLDMKATDVCIKAFSKNELKNEMNHEVFIANNVLGSELEKVENNSFLEIENIEKNEDITNHIIAINNEEDIDDFDGELINTEEKNDLEEFLEELEEDVEDDMVISQEIVEELSKPYRLVVKRNVKEYVEVDLNQIQKNFLNYLEMKEQFLSEETKYHFNMQKEEIAEFLLVWSLINF